MSTKERLSCSEPILLENHPNDSRVKKKAKENSKCQNRRQ